jgi:hypothetical protein
VQILQKGSHALHRLDLIEVVACLMAGGSEKYRPTPVLQGVFRCFFAGKAFEYRKNPIG